MQSLRNIPWTTLRTGRYSLLCQWSQRISFNRDSWCFWEDDLYLSVWWHPKQPSAIYVQHDWFLQAVGCFRGEQTGNVREGTAVTHQSWRMICSWSIRAAWPISPSVGGSSRAWFSLATVSSLLNRVQASSSLFKDGWQASGEFLCFLHWPQHEWAFLHLNPHCLLEKYKIDTFWDQICFP